MQTTVLGHYKIFSCKFHVLQLANVAIVRISKAACNTYETPCGMYV